MVGVAGVELALSFCSTAASQSRARANEQAWQQTATWLNGSGPVPVAVALEAHGQR